MAKVKTDTLIGHPLDWAVATGIGGAVCIENGVFLNQGDGYEYFTPTVDWEQGGNIIEREDIAFRRYHNPKSESHGIYYARVCRESGTLVGWYKTTGFQQTGPTPLIAAMRCYVASKLGDEIDVPEGLL